MICVQVSEGRAEILAASHEHILLPFSTPQPQALPSADSKSKQAANNKERLGVRHDIV
jgi:hypothetical protein